MNSFFRVLFGLLLLSLAVSLSGCQDILHNLQPHRLHHMNRGNGMRSPSEVYSHQNQICKDVYNPTLV